MVRTEFVEFIVDCIGQSAEELKNYLNDLAAAEQGETLFPQSDEEKELRDELSQILIQLTPTLDKIEEIHDFYEGLMNAFGTYNPA
ncbi:MAG: hypothetical protein IK084_01620 [Bacteroidaceae bacterium]|nr:hypothetical protein [Bacteroidaceae bacterium]